MNKRMATFLMIFGGLLTFWILVVGYNVTTGPHTTLGIVDGKLAPVPPSPNAVSTCATDEEHRMKPVTYKGSTELAMERVAEVVETMPRSTIAERKGNYLRAEYQSGLFRFVDDVEFLADEETNTLHFRSASRLGHSDLGANRARMEEFSRRFRMIQEKSTKE